MIKAVFILSSKSSGSTALQNYLKNNFGYKTVKYTQHQEEETLYWTKVASILRLPQESLYRSVVPIKAEKAVNELNEFFLKNDVPNVQCDLNTTEKEFQDFFFQLIQNSGDKFVEKSPHHLYNQSNLQLLLNFKKEYKEKVDIKILGLVRHPQAVIYSAWRRWKYFPEKFQNEWLNSYRKLLEWRDRLGILIIRYEDLVTNEINLSSILGEEENPEGDFRFRTSSLNKWREDPSFGFSVSKEVEFLAQKFEYQNFITHRSLRWKMSLWKYKLIFAAKVVVRKLRKK